MMEKQTLFCENQIRRDKIRESNELNGLDFVEVSEDQLTLKVYLLRKASKELQSEFNDSVRGKKHIIIEGGTRIYSVIINSIALKHPEGSDKDDFLEINIAKRGDFSTYTLRVAQLDDKGHPTNEPMEGFDPRYARLTFGFKVHCPSDLDCKTSEICPPPERPEPDINYLAKDYASFRQLILDRLAQIMPDWQERHVPDLGITLVEILAYAADHLSYYQDAVATEAYLDTSRQRISVRRHARLVDYRLHEGCNARAWLFVETSDDMQIGRRDIYFMTHFDESEAGKVLLQEDIENLNTRNCKIFEPMQVLPDTCSQESSPDNKKIQFLKAHNEINIYTWLDKQCCLPKGAVNATLVDGWVPGEDDVDRAGRLLKLKAGDILFFEEVKGSVTGNETDADKGHRHFVKLTDVEQDVDPLNNQPLLHITWDTRDALPFALCISSLGPAPDCSLIENISVARGNIILVDQGQIQDEEDLGTVELKEANTCCREEGVAFDTELFSEKFNPQLDQPSLTFSQPADVSLPASEMLKQDPSKAAPQLILCSSNALPGDRVEQQLWQPVYDLLRSDREDRHFVTEIDNDRRVHIRFGDGQAGRKPQVGESFKAIYRTGNGRQGNVGAEIITQAVTRNIKINGIKLFPCNPLPAGGGSEPQSLQKAKLQAPASFRSQLERAITPNDYAQLAERNTLVQRASAVFRWNGSWTEVLVAIDPLGAAKADRTLLEQVYSDLMKYRRMGHDLLVKSAVLVPLEIRMEVCILPGYIRGQIKSELLRLFGHTVLEDGSKGYFHPDNLTFGQAIRLSDLVAVAQSVTGVESVDITVMNRLFEEPNNELENGLLQLEPLEIARLDNDPSFPENGRLDIIVRGGQ